MQFLDLTLGTVAENLALEEALLLEAEAGRAGETLRVWEFPELAVVLGTGVRLAEEVNEVACAADQVPIGRRSSGGGTVLLGRGCLLYSLILDLQRGSALQEIRSSYAYILERMSSGLRALRAGIEHAGTSDLAADGRKFSGNAQHRKRRYLLHHGTLLYDFDRDLVGRYLHLPSRQPVYRAGREHGAFLMNLPVTSEELKGCLQRIWEAQASGFVWPRQATQQLTAEKYTKLEWIYRR